MVSPSRPMILLTVRRFSDEVGDQSVTMSPRDQGFRQVTCHLSRKIQSRVVWRGQSRLSVGCGVGGVEEGRKERYRVEAPVGEKGGK